MLKRAEAGAVVMELCRKQGNSSAVYYAWKANFSGPEPSTRNVCSCQRKDTHSRNG
ncbi:transposase [Sphingomonas profundi]|uniref:transposase n=1 Tax=Alterirhizorhabdus profundi TaxID=2681549 RepID=UPI003BAFC164